MLLNPIDLDQTRERYEAYAIQAMRAPRAGTRATLRRAIGRRLIAAGRRIAAEPTLELARSPR
jgi:hypothetical protein